MSPTSKFGKYCKLLTLAYKAPDDSTMLDWRPFGKDNMDTIINRSNENSYVKFKKLDWTDSCIRDKVQGISLIQKVDLSTVSIDKPEDKDYDDIRIILVDLDAIKDKERDKIVNEVKPNMSPNHGLFQVVQISRSPLLSRATELFGHTQILLSTPDVILDQGQFQEWLDSPNNRVLMSIAKSMPSPATGGPIALSYNESKPEAAALLKDIAISERLSRGETAEKANLVGSYLLALGKSAFAHTGSESPIDLSQLIKPIASAPIEVTAPLPANVVALKLTGPRHLLSNEQQRVAADLGIRDSEHITLHLDDTELRDKIEILKDQGLVTVTDFAVPLAGDPELGGKSINLVRQ